MTKAGFIPLAELNSGKGASSVIFDLELPDYAPADTILINVPKMKRIANLGGLSLVQITNYSGEVTSYNPEINEVDDHGTATAGNKGSIKKAETERTSLEAPSRPSRYDSYNWSRLALSINQEELEDSILQAGKSVRDPKEWSSRIDLSLKSGLLNGARQQLLGKERFLQSARVAAASPINGLLLTVGQDVPNFAIKEAMGYVWLNTGIQMAETFFATKESCFSRRRISFFSGMQLDRYAAAWALARTTTLAKAER